MDTVKVSVIIPTYKRSEDLARAVNSVLAQSLEAVEVIVVDDNGIGSEAGKMTEAVMEQFRGNEKVIYLRHEVNKNGSAARNTGIRASRGEYIAFLDDDDVFRPERLKLMCEKLDSLDESWGTCYSGYVKHQPDGSDQYSSEKAEGDAFVQALMRSLYIGTGSNLFFRRSVVEDIGLFDESFRRNQDLEYIVRVLKKYKIAYVDEVLVEKYHDIRTVHLTLEQSWEREQNFRSKFSHHLDDLPAKTQREIRVMWDLDWVRFLLDSRKPVKALGAIFSSKIPLKVLAAYALYALDRIKHNTSYGFVVKL